MRVHAALFVLLSLALIANASAKRDVSRDRRWCYKNPKLTCWFAPTKMTKSTIFGKILMRPVFSVRKGCQTMVNGSIYGLGPDNTPHGWHIHNYGDISDGTGKATGGHYNPYGRSHGLEMNAPHHVGDLGNLHPDAKGAIPSFKMVLPQPLLTKRVVGRAVIIHNLIDDGGQPTGNAGNRIAQCVLGYAP